MFREPVSQAASRLSDVQGIAERARDAIDNIAGGAGEGVDDGIGSMVGASEAGGVGEVRASAATWAGAGERAGLGGRVREGAMDQKVSKVVGSFERGEGSVREEV